MTTQTKEQQAVALAEKHDAPAGFIADLRLNRLIVEWFFNLLADHAQQVREAHTAELVANAATVSDLVALGKAWFDADLAWDIASSRHPDDEPTFQVLEKERAFKEAIAAMQAQYESAKEAAVLLATLTRESADEVFKLRQRVAELERDAAQETGWLIEFTPNNIGIHWLDHQFSFTKDNLKAMRFARKEDAEAMLTLIFEKASKGEVVQVIQWHFGGLGNKSLWKVTEHIWLDAAMKKGGGV